MPTVTAEQAERIQRAAETGIAGQQRIDGSQVPPEDDPNYEPPLPPENLEVAGTAQLDMFDMGGKLPQSASIRFTGGKVALVHGTAYRKGDVIHFAGTAVVTAVKQQDKRDSSTGIVVDCEQQHSALITDLRVS